MLEQHKLHHTPDGRWLHLLEVEHLAISVRDDAHKAWCVYHPQQNTCYWCISPCHIGRSSMLAWADICTWFGVQSYSSSDSWFTHLTPPWIYSPRPDSWFWSTTFSDHRGPYDTSYMNDHLVLILVPVIDPDIFNNWKTQDCHLKLWNFDTFNNRKTLDCQLKLLNLRSALDDGGSPVCTIVIASASH